MKGLLGINYSQHLAHAEDLEDVIPADYEEGRDKKSCILLGQNSLLVFITGGLILGGTKHNFLCDNIFVR